MREKTEEILPPYRLELARNLNRIRDAWYAYALRFCEKEDYLTHAEHLMIVSRKQQEKNEVSEA